MQLQLHDGWFYKEKDPGGFIYTVYKRILELANWFQNSLCSIHSNCEDGKAQDKEIPLSPPRGTSILWGLLHRKRDSVQVWVFALMGNSAFSVSWFCFSDCACPSVQWQCGIRLYLSAMPGHCINICAKAFGSLVHVCSLRAEVFGGCEGRVWIWCGSTRAGGPISSSLSTKLHARTGLLCLLFPSFSYECWFYTFSYVCIPIYLCISVYIYYIYISFKCSSHRLVFRS